MVAFVIYFQPTWGCPVFFPLSSWVTGCWLVFKVCGFIFWMICIFWSNEFYTLEKLLLLINMLTKSDMGQIVLFVHRSSSVSKIPLAWIQHRGQENMLQYCGGLNWHACSCTLGCATDSTVGYASYYVICKINGLDATHVVKLLRCEWIQCQLDRTVSEL